MNKKPPIRFGLLIRSERTRPGLISWFVVGALILAVAYLAFHGFAFWGLGLMAVGVGLLVFLPALTGAFLGWFFGGVRREWKLLREHQKVTRSFRH